MKRYTFFITEEQLSFIEKLAGNASEHIRRAIDDYLTKIKNQGASTSPSVNRHK